ncbi:MAG: hypothetical protein PHX67_02135, partial [Candidatus Pacebacteria bacterium]|nr:hypothetical protein [Candidatus Paceibacterota bacterium]MDD5545438.1 hypothetical protein [Candidatus Paceibacterota bacterium]
AVNLKERRCFPMEKFQKLTSEQELKEAYEVIQRVLEEKDPISIKYCIAVAKLLERRDEGFFLKIQDERKKGAESGLSKNKLRLINLYLSHLDIFSLDSFLKKLEKMMVKGETNNDWVRR